ncbi:winged helix-turn-helix domain-containing protein [Saccharibacillus sp. CPCC 101409]|uniref:ArsR/SmtB family transcription factor n=1 Tax=Saccharibacillus sp. CPCC 101409 TaxID=3058041 RepID=UPI002672DCBD|nr:winged helix-turn-helix domain-containing protein [Saccharibacillus sp. CPCC 101409]MDO3411224.1 winged helix-turn-helix domain-containing protein [Saccharibacillus sp. CPCC 101409]
MVDLNGGAELSQAFKRNQKLLNAIGDETRQAIIITLMRFSRTPGMRVGEITERTNLSRPAVSHHLRILKEAQIVNVHKRGTMNFYYLDSIDKLKQLKALTELLMQCETQQQAESGD